VLAVFGSHYGICCKSNLQFHHPISNGNKIRSGAQREMGLHLPEWLNKALGLERSEKPPSDIGEVVEGVTPHSHCQRCEKAITLGKRFCSEVCKRGEGRKGPSSLVWIIILMLLMLLLFSR